MCQREEITFTYTTSLYHITTYLLPHRLSQQPHSKYTYAVTLKMEGFSHLVRFQCEEDKSSCFADLGTDANGPPSRGTVLEAYKSVEDLVQKKDPKNATVFKVRPSWFQCVCPHS